MSSAYLAVSLLSMTSIAIAVLRNQFIATIRMAGIMLDFSLIVLVYKKMMKLSLSSIQSTSIEDEEEQDSSPLRSDS